MINIPDSMSNCVYFKNENYCLCTGGLLIVSLKFCDKIFMSSAVYSCMRVQYAYLHVMML